MPAKGWTRAAPIFLGAALLAPGCTYDFGRYDPVAGSDGGAPGSDAAQSEDSPGTGGDALAQEAGPGDSGRSAGDGSMGDAGIPPGDASTPLFTVGGMLSGLRQGRHVVLQDNGGDNLTVAANGSFVFAQALASGATYRVTVATQPQNQMCRVTGVTGTVGTVNVTSVAVVCQ